MILSDREILAAVARGAIDITPCPPAGHRQWTSTALDLTLDAEIRPWEDPAEGVAPLLIDPAQDGFDSVALVERQTQPHDCSHGYVIPPKCLVLGWTVEKIKLPHTAKIAARVEGKSSLARIGLGIHVTAPTIHAGFGFSARDPHAAGSPIRLEIWNIGSLAIRLTQGMPICQLIFEEVHGTPDQGYAGQFHVQGPDASSTRRGPRARRAKRS